MQEVQFLSYEGEDEPNYVGRAMLEGGRIVFQGVPSGFEGELIEVGIAVGSKRFYPKDGLDFLAGLKHAFSGSRFRATGVREV